MIRYTPDGKVDRENWWVDRSPDQYVGEFADALDQANIDVRVLDRANRDGMKATERFADDNVRLRTELYATCDDLRRARELLAELLRLSDVLGDPRPAMGAAWAAARALLDAGKVDV